ncbi:MULTISPECIES: hypothetical protein [unclassified Saccharothrix]|uniref:hypothetical protein n=1 Tax=unclassified Saccharothrix TaxID=2593673 RepID=UPI00307FCB9F
MSTVELDERLRELFSDERLDLPAREDAVPRIVGGARRRRRTRSVATGALVVAAVVGGVVAAQGLTADFASEPGTSPTSTTTIRPQALEPPAHGPFRLGMPAAEVVAKGYPVAPAGPCAVHLGSETSYDVVVSPRGEVVGIRTPRFTRTPSGVGHGSTPAELRGPYPDLVEAGDRVTVAMGSDWGYVFELDQGKVSVVRIEKTGGGCGSGG